MPSTYFSCTEDTAKQQALKDFKEELSRQVAKIDIAAEDFKTNAAVFNEDQVAATKAAFDNVIASSQAGLQASGQQLVSGQYQATDPSGDVLNAIGLPLATTKADLEALLSARHDLHIIDGQVIAPGTVSLTEAKLLYQRLDYNLLELRRLLSQSHGWPFILVALQVTKTDADLGTNCAPGKAAEDTTLVLGVNENLKTLAADNGIAFSDITPEIYWLESIDTSPRIIRLLRGLGLSPEQIGLALTEGISAVITTYLIENPDAVLDLLGLSDTEMDTMLKRQNLDTVNPDPEPSDLISAVKDRLGGAFLDKDSNKVATMQPPSLLLAQTIDIRRFGSVIKLGSSEIIEYDLYSEEVVASLDLAVSAVQAAFDAMAAALAAFQAALEALLSPILAMLTLVENLLNSFASGGPPLLQCLFGALSVNISLNMDFFDSLFDALDKLLDPLFDILKLLNDILSLLGAPACLLQSILAAILDSIPSNPALECISLMAQYGFDLFTDAAQVPDSLWSDSSPPEPGKTFAALAEIADLMAAMVAEVQAMLRDLAMWAHNIAFNLDLGAADRSENCDPLTIVGILAQMVIEEVI